MGLHSKQRGLDLKQGGLKRRGLEPPETPLTLTTGDDQAELAWMAWLNTMMLCAQKVSRLTINPA